MAVWLAQQRTDRRHKAMGDSYLGSTVQQHDNRLLLPGTPSLRYSAVSVVASCECCALRCQEVNILLQVALPGEKAPDTPNALQAPTTDSRRRESKSQLFEAVSIISASNLDRGLEQH